jgi:hypothetical protein
MTSRIRGIIGAIVKYRGKMGGPPRWMEELQLPPLPGMDAAAEGEVDCEEEGGEEEMADFQPDSEEDVEAAADDAASSSSKPAEPAKVGQARKAESEPEEPRKARKFGFKDAHVGIVYDYGWDAEKKRAWRMPCGAKRSEHREYAIKMLEPLDGKAFSCMRAEFEGGAIKDIALVTLEEYRGGRAAEAAGERRRGHGRRGRGRGAATATELERFKGELNNIEVEVHLKSNHRNVGGTKKMQRLVCIRHGTGNQVIQLDCKHWKTASATTDQQAEAAAVAWANDVAKKYVDKTIDAMGVEDAKQDFFKSLGLDNRGKAKRKAARAADSTAEGEDGGGA